MKTARWRSTWGAGRSMRALNAQAAPCGFVHLTSTSPATSAPCPAGAVAGGPTGAARVMNGIARQATSRRISGFMLLLPQIDAVAGTESGENAYAIAGTAAAEDDRG